MASDPRGGLDWVLGNASSQKGWSDIGNQQCLELFRESLDTALGVALAVLGWYLASRISEGFSSLNDPSLNDPSHEGPDSVQPRLFWQIRCLQTR